MFEAFVEEFNINIAKLKNYFYGLLNFGKTRYTIDNIKLLGNFMIDNKKIYTLKSCLVEATKMYDSSRSKLYVAMIRQVDIENLNMVYFYSNAHFNDLMEEMRQIRHPNINGGPIIFHNKYFLPFNSTNITKEEKLFFIYKKSQGICLTDIITEDDKPLRYKNEAVFALLEQVTSGLNYLHNKDIAHGELTPDCIHLRYDGVWIISYVGFFTILSHLQYSSDLREKISLYFKSPEVIQTNDIFCKEEDVWALGVIIYNIYCGFDDYYFENLEPILQCEPELCLLNMFENFGPFSGQKKIPKTFFNICAGGIWKKKEERVSIDILYKLMQSLSVDSDGEIICSDEDLYNEFVYNITSTIDSFQKPNYDEAMYIYQTMLEKICSHTTLTTPLGEEDYEHMK
uniref:Protein kinase domain-containing protein n=1 Tax=Strongyloides papillosus TaxID=174720 RepID=A0A0N5BM80_STREA